MKEQHLIYLNRLFILHAIITFAAGVVLIALPALIPSTVDISISRDQNLLCYFLGAAEIALAYLSFMGSRITDIKALKWICMTFIVFHGLTALVEILAYTEGISKNIFGNVFARLLIMALFIQFGTRKLKSSKQ